MKDRKILLPLLATMLLLAGCAGGQVREEKTAQELAAEGTAQFEKEDYRYAIITFEKLKDWYPFSKLATLAELKIADAYYHVNEYDAAILAYRDFESLHPRNEAIPYVLYQIGRCWFERLDAIDRDQTYARNALNAFLRLTRQFPEDPYSQTAREHIDACLKSLAENEFYVGMFYYKGKHYKAALKRFESVITDYPDVGVQKKALQYIARCHKNIEENPERPRRNYK
ncbi:MAG: outer membrane protein assembly factor BamD [Desulfobacterales bacterium]